MLKKIKGVGGVLSISFCLSACHQKMTYFSCKKEQVFQPAKPHTYTHKKGSGFFDL
jgi:hypothetical protein